MSDWRDVVKATNICVSTISDCPRTRWKPRKCRSHSVKVLRKKAFALASRLRPITLMVKPVEDLSE